MASYHLSVKTIKRSAGRSVTAAAAYRAGCEIVCEREGRVHDYTRKLGVADRFILAPDDAPDWAQDRAALWNAAEARETRSNSVTAREWELALPAELTEDAAARVTVLAWRVAVLAAAILLTGGGGPALRDAAGEGGPTILGSIAELITVTGGHEASVAAALGSASEALAVGSASDAAAAVRGHQRGRGIERQSRGVGPGRQ